MKKSLVLIIMTTLTISFAKDFNIEDYGAIGDGKSLCSDVIQKAIDDISC